MSCADGYYERYGNKQPNEEEPYIYSGEEEHVPYD